MPLTSYLVARGIPVGWGMIASILIAGGISVLFTAKVEHKVSGAFSSKMEKSISRIIDN